MIDNSILTKEELEALLTPEELLAYIAEQEDQLEHELMLSPAHLLLALRELEDTVVRLTTRVEQLEYQSAQKPIQVAGFDASIVSDDAALKEELSAEEAVTYIEPLEPFIESFIESQAEPLESQQDSPIMPHIDQNIELQAEPLEEAIKNSDVSDMELAMLLSNVAAALDEAEPSPNESVHSTPSLEEPSLISRSARHRDRKPSLLSKLLK
jgi:hypothetical protein